jgi:hypothetical protein
MDEITNWINKEIKDISNSSTFKKYFDNVELTNGENTFYLTTKQRGIELVLSKYLKITSIHIFAGTKKEYQKFEDRLPFEVKFSFSKEDIKKIFGKPSKSGGGHTALYIGYISLWDKYYFNGYSLHFQYSEDGTSIDAITIASLELEEYFNSEQQ